MPTPTDSVKHPEVESPVAHETQGAAGPPQEKEKAGDERPADSGDQDIDTAGTDHDDESPTKSL
jgi:hypothetical protein